MAKNKKPQRIEVTTGASDGDYTAITEGNIKEGDRVIIDSSNTQKTTAKRRRMGIL